MTSQSSPETTAARHAQAAPEEADPQEALNGELALVFRQHADFVWRVLKRLGTPEADLEDALQEVFLIVARKLSQYEERGGMRAWLFAIARQVASHARRAQLRRERREQAQPCAEADDDPHRALERSEAAEFVQTFLAQLDERQAMVFFLAEVEGMTAPEIAACLGVGLNTVYGRLRLSRERFERALRRRTNGASP